ncbi:MAG: T9SS type A sorting domain-containing protein [Bacteroidales bacterium]|jgi:hypothetical protein|nr:T9SS type A sorting domain-containing protein [Bacteroidales bacterium]
MKQLILIISVFYSINSVFGQIQEGGVPESFNLRTKSMENPKSFVFNFDEKQIKSINDSVYDVGIAENVSIDFIVEASYSIYNNIEIYQLKIEVTNILGVGLEFSNFYVPKEGKLFVFNENRSTILGAYTSNNNHAGKEFAIQPISGSTIILEYNQPIEIKDKPSLIINRISKIYRPLFSNNQISPQRSSSCYIDVHCYGGFEVDRSVMKWLFYDEKDEKYYICSCALINQDVLANNIKPYVLTANHCGKNAKLSTAIFYFNYQNSQCGYSNAMEDIFTMVGASERAKRSLYDMFLLELFSFPPPDYNVHLAGWDRSNHNDLTLGIIGIHHPHGEPKKISWGTFADNTNPNFWRIRWNLNEAPTAGGSSGSPLFEDDYYRIIGWLSYGVSECYHIFGIDRYGKFRNAWSSVFGSDQRLKDWLDPNDNDKNQLDGRDPCFTNLVIQNRTFYSARQLYQPENKVTIQAGKTIETSGNVVIKSGAEYKFTAGEKIIFNSGFKVESGAKFTATIEPCDMIAKSMNVEKEPTALLYYENPLVSQFETNALDLNIQTSICTFPNPSKDFITIEFSLSKSDIISIGIYSLHGILISSLINNQQYDKGIYQINLNIQNLSNGLYNCIIKTHSTQKNCFIIKSN